MHMALSSLLIWVLWFTTAPAAEIVPVLDGAAEIEVPDGYVRSGPGVDEFVLADAEPGAGIATHFNVGTPPVPWDWEQFQTWARENAAARREGRFEEGLFGTAEDEATGYRHLAGVLGAFAYFICDERQDALICVWGMDRDALIEFEDNPPPQDVWRAVSPEGAIALLRGPGNADLLEGVLASFRWKER